MEEKWQPIECFSDSIKFVSLGPVIGIIGSKEEHREKKDIELVSSLSSVKYFPDTIYKIIQKAINKEAPFYDLPRVTKVLKNDKMIEKGFYIYLIQNISASPYDHNREFILAINLNNKSSHRFGRWEVEKKEEKNGHYISDLKYLGQSFLNKINYDPAYYMDLIFSYILIQSGGHIDYTIYSDSSKKCLIDELKKRGINNIEQIFNKLFLPQYNINNKREMFIKFSLFYDNKREIIIENHQFSYKNEITIFPEKWISITKDGIIKEH